MRWTALCLPVLIACSASTKPAPSAAQPPDVARPSAAEPEPVRDENQSAANENRPVANEHRPAESQPEFWLKKLDDVAWRPRAIQRLEMLYEDIVTIANADRQAPEVRRFVDRTVEPLTKLYVEQYDLLDTKTRVATIRLLASYRDTRTERALLKAFEEFAKAPTTDREESDIKWASQAQGALRLESLAMPMFSAFAKLHASTLLGGIAYRDMNEAMMQQPSKAWVRPMIAMLEPEIPRVDPKDRKSFDQARDQLFWQVTAAEALGRIGDPAAVEPLMMVMLEPTKADVQYTAGLALIKLGRHTTNVAIRLLKSEHEKLQKYQASRLKKVTGKPPKGKPWVAVAAKVLGAVGRREAVQPLIAIVETTQDDADLVVATDELTRIPGSPEAKEAFKKAYPRTPLASRTELSEAAGRFLDPAFVPWLLAMADSVKGAAAERETTRAALLLTALKLAKPSQLADVKAAANRFGVVREELGKVEPLVQRCRENGRCYLEALKNPDNQSYTNQLVGIKAGYMIGVLGNDELRDELVGSLAPITNPALRHVAAQSIDRLTPNGSRAIVEELGAIIETNAKSPDRDKAAADNSLKQVQYRLGARADLP